MSRSWLVRYVGVLVGGFATMFLLTRSSILVGDARAYIDVARVGDPGAFHFANPSHFLQVPLARGIWLGLLALHVPASLEQIFVALALVGTLVAIVCVGLIAAEVVGERWVAWLAATMFGVSLHVWTQVNGEQYGLALGFVTAAVWFALRGQLVAPALLWALAMAAHSEFMFAGPVLIWTVWQTSAPGKPGRRSLVAAGGVVALAGASVSSALLVASWALGKWTTPDTLVHWLQTVLAVDHKYTIGRPEVFRALKGLFTALTVGGHFVRDLMTGRGEWDNAAFLVQTAIGLLIILLTMACLASAWRMRRVGVMALLWLLPFHVLGNWWFLPTVEKYHAGALPGFVLLVTAGLVSLTSRWPLRQRALCAAFVVVLAALNYWGAVRPIAIRGQELDKAVNDLRGFQEARGGHATFIACDASSALVDAGLPFYRIRSFWTGTVPEIQDRIAAWAESQVAEGREVYLVGGWCYPEEWNTRWSKAPFNLHFLDRQFRFTPTSITNMPIEQTVPTNPFSWLSGDVVRLEPRGGR